MLYELPSLSELYFEYVNIFNPYIVDFPHLKKLSIIDGNVETVENINNLPLCTYINLSENEEIDNEFIYDETIKDAKVVIGINDVQLETAKKLLSN